MALAKMRLEIGIDGDKVVVERIDKVGESIDRAGRKTRTATEQMAAGMNNVESATGRMAATHGQAMGKMSATTRMNHSSMTAFEQQIQSVTMRVWNLTMAAGMIAAPFVAAGAAILFGLNAIDDFQMSVTQIAAQLTQLQGPKDVAKHYQESVVYATALAEKMEEVDESSSANSKGLMAMLQVMTTQGMVLDINNKKQVTAFTDLSNAIAYVTRGQDQQMQAYQEMRSLTTGQIDHNSQLSRMLDSQIKHQGVYKDGLKEVVDLGRQHGDLLERLQPYLVGINASTVHISKSWQTASSSMETAVNKVTREGFKEVFADIVPLVSQTASYLKSHAEIIGNKIQQGWLAVKGLVGGVFSLLSGFREPLGIIGNLTSFILNGWGMLLYTIFPPLAGRIGSFIESLWDMVKVFGNLANVLANLSIGNFKGAADSWADAKTAWTASGKKAGDAFASGLSDEITKRASEWQALDLQKKNKTTATAPIISPSPADKPEMAEDKYLKDLERVHESYLQYKNAFDNREMSDIKNATDLQLAALKNRHEQGLISEQSFLDAKYFLDKSAINKDEIIQLDAAMKAQKAADEAERAMENSRVGKTDTFDADAIIRRNKALQEAETAWKAVSSSEAKALELDITYAGATTMNAKKQVIDSANLAIAQYEHQLTLIDQAEKTYALTTEQAAQRRIPLLQHEAIEQQKIYDDIKGNEPISQMLRQQTIDKITAINGKLQDQQKLLYDSPAIGGMTNAIQKYGDDATNIGKQVETVFTNAFKNIEDAIVQAFQTGKIDGKAMIQAIQADLIRMTIAKPITNYLAQSIGSLGNMFGGGSTGGISGDTAAAGSGGALMASSSTAASAGAMVGVGIGLSIGTHVIISAFEGLADTSKAADEAVATLLKSLSVLSDELDSRAKRLAGDDFGADTAALKAKQDQETLDLMNSFKAFLGTGSTDADVQMNRDFIKRGTAEQQALNQNLLGENSRRLDGIYAYSSLLDKLESVHAAEAVQLQDLANQTTNNLRMKELELEGLKTSAEYLDLLAKQRNAEVFGMSDTDEAIQRHIYLLQDQAAANETASTALSKTIDIALSAANAITAIQGGSLSTDSPEEKLRKAKAAWDTASPENAGELGKSYLTALQGMYASGAGYQAGYADVMNQLGTIAGMTGTTAAEQQVALLQSIKEALTLESSPLVSALTALGDWSLTSAVAVQGSFAVGTPYVPFDMSANIHEGEIIIDRPSANVLRKYGIPTSGSADNKELVEEIKSLRAEVAKQGETNVRLQQAIGTKLIAQGDEANRNGKTVAQAAELRKAA